MVTREEIDWINIQLAENNPFQIMHRQGTYLIMLTQNKRAWQNAPHPIVNIVTRLETFEGLLIVIVIASPSLPLPWNFFTKVHLHVWLLRVLARRRKLPLIRNWKLKWLCNTLSICKIAEHPTRYQNSSSSSPPTISRASCCMLCLSVLCRFTTAEAVQGKLWQLGHLFFARHRLESRDW